MTAKSVVKSVGFNPFGELIGLSFSFPRCRKGYSECVLEVSSNLLNPHGVVHGGVIYSMADTGMGGALYPYLGHGELCATIEIQIVYFKSVASGTLTCETKLVHRSGHIAVLELVIRNDEYHIAKAIGTFSIFQPRRA
ncbi:MAG: PaaI family thioesterase [Dehalococcoidia bacterium]